MISLCYNDKVQALHTSNSMTNITIMITIRILRYRNHVIVGRHLLCITSIIHYTWITLPDKSIKNSVLLLHFLVYCQIFQILLPTWCQTAHFSSKTSIRCMPEQFYGIFLFEQFLIVVFLTSLAEHVFKLGIKLWCMDVNTHTLPGEISEQKVGCNYIFNQLCSQTISPSALKS